MQDGFALPAHAGELCPSAVFMSMQDVKSEYFLDLHGVSLASRGTETLVPHSLSNGRLMSF